MTLRPGTALRSGRYLGALAACLLALPVLPALAGPPPPPKHVPKNLKPAPLLPPGRILHIAPGQKRIDPEVLKQAPTVDQVVARKVRANKGKPPPALWRVKVLPESERTPLPPRKVRPPVKPASTAKPGSSGKAVSPGKPAGTKRTAATRKP